MAPEGSRIRSLTLRSFPKAIRAKYPISLHILAQNQQKRINNNKKERQNYIILHLNCKQDNEFCVGKRWNMHKDQYTKGISRAASLKRTVPIFHGKCLFIASFRSP